MTDGSAPAIAFLRERLTRAPRVVLVLGSGLGSIADQVIDAVRIPYPEIPGFSSATVAGHEGALIAGVLEGVEVVVMRGRFHLYEGAAASAVALPILALRALGADHLIITNAAGGIRADLAPGDLMLIADHINFTFRNPLIGAIPIGESRFPDMSDPYDASLRSEALTVAAELRMPLVQGVYAGVLGPSFETPAEVRMLARLGADVVGMSTVLEVIVARALGMRVLGISCVTNSATRVVPMRLTHEEVLEVGAASSERLARLLRTLLPRIVPLNLPTEAAE